MVTRTTDVPPRPGSCPHRVPTPSLRAVAAGWLTALDEVFVPSGSRSGSHAATKAPVGPGGWDAAAWLLHPPGFTRRSLVRSHFKADRSKMDLERNYNFCPVTCCSFLHSRTCVGLSRSGCRRPVCLSSSDSVAKPSLWLLQGPLPWALPGPLGTSCSRGRGHGCALAVHSLLVQKHVLFLHI